MLVLLGTVLAAVSPSTDTCEHNHAGDLIVETQRDIPACLETIEGNLVLGSDRAELDFPTLTDVTGKLDVTLARQGRARLPRLERVHRGLELKLRGPASIELPRLEVVAGPIGLDLGPDGRRPSLPRLRRHRGGLWLFGGGDLGGLLTGLEQIDGTVYLQPTGDLSAALPALSRIGGHLVISNGGHLEVGGFARLTVVEGGVYVFGGQALTLPALSRVDGALAIRDSRARDLDGIGRPGIRLGALLLRDNPRLERWPDHLTVPADRVRVDGSPGLPRRGRLGGAARAEATAAEAAATARTP